MLVLKLDCFPLFLLYLHYVSAQPTAGVDPSFYLQKTEKKNKRERVKELERKREKKIVKEKNKGKKKKRKEKERKNKSMKKKGQKEMEEMEGDVRGTNALLPPIFFKCDLWGRIGSPSEMLEKRFDLGFSLPFPHCYRSDETFQQRSVE